MRIIINHTYYTLCSGISPSWVAIRQNYVCSRHYCNIRVSGICKLTCEELRFTCSTPRFTEDCNLRIQCLRDQYYLLKIRSKKQTGSLGWDCKHCNIINWYLKWEECDIIYTISISVGHWLNDWRNAKFSNFKARYLVVKSDWNILQ
jgi:hypothetical protein